MKPMANLQGNEKQVIFKWSTGTFDVKPYLKEKAGIAPIFASPHGALFAADCMNVLPLIADEVIDTVFADPPFNLGKEYGTSTDDLQPDDTYLDWCHQWLIRMRPHSETRRVIVCLQPARSGTSCSGLT